MDTRVNLHVYTTLADGRAAYDVLHIGFFTPAVARAVARNISARGLAYHSDVAGQTGRVDVVTCVMLPGYPAEVVERIESYEPPQTRDA